MSSNPEHSERARARARALAEQALDAYAERGEGSERDLAEVEEWLRRVG